MNDDRFDSYFGPGDETWMCSICFEPKLPFTMVSPCGHTFCEACVKKIKTCAQCRAPIQARVMQHEMNQEVEKRARYRCKGGCGFICTLSETSAHQCDGLVAFERRRSAAQHDAEERARQAAETKAREEALEARRQREAAEREARERAAAEQMQLEREAALRARREQEAAEAARRAAAPAPRPGEKYDAVIKARLFRDVYDAARGWSVDPYNQAVVGNPNVHTVFVSPIGHFNAGKTFIVNKLSGRKLPCGDRTHTQGLSIAVTPINPGLAVEPNQPLQQIAWMDTAGLDSPVVETVTANDEDDLEPADVAQLDPAAAAAHSRRSVDSLYGQLREVKRLEDFHRRVAFEFADVFLFVVNQISHNDQLEILTLVQQIQRASTTKSVFVVHNLREWTLSQLNAVKDDGMTYVSRMRTLFFMAETQVTVSAMVDADKNLVFGGVTPVGTPRSVSSDVKKLYGTLNQHNPRHLIQVQHVFLVNEMDRADSDYNACVLQHLRTEVLLTSPKPGSIKKHMEDIMTKVQHHFAQTDSTDPPQLKFVQRANEWRVQTVAPDMSVRSLPVVTPGMQLPSYLTLSSDDLQYNVLKLKGSTSVAAAANGTPGSVEKIMYAIQFVIPGLHPSDVDQIKEVMKWHTGALRLEKSPEGRKTLVIDFSTCEHVAQGQLLTKIQNSIDREAMSILGSMPELLEEGTRSFFDPASNSRLVTVQLGTGLEKLSTMTRPLVAYNDGILSIVVTSSERPSPPAQA